MMAYTDAVGGFRRELAVYMPDPALAACLTVILEASDLGLGRICPARLAIPDHIMFFKQRNTSFSRKKCSRCCTVSSPVKTPADRKQPTGHDGCHAGYTCRLMA